MITRNITYTILFALLFFGCSLISKAPEILIKKDFNGKEIAVLNFVPSGNFILPNIGKIAADKLTNALFLEGKFSVIDRAKVNDTQFSLSIKSTDILSEDNIQQLGLKLKANYLILGQIQDVGRDEYLSTDPEGELFINFRIISVKDSGVVGLATASSKYGGDIYKVVDKMMKEIVNSISNY